MEWVGEPTRRDPTRYQMHLISIPVFVSACVSDCIGRESWAFGCFENTSLEMLSQERRGEGGLQRICSQISARSTFISPTTAQRSKPDWNFSFDMNSQKPSWGFLVLLEYASWRFSQGVDYSRWSQVWVLKPDPSELLEPSCYQIFWTNLRALAKKVIDSLPFSIAPELITDTLWCAREQIWAEKNLWG